MALNTIWILTFFLRRGWMKSSIIDIKPIPLKSNVFMLTILVFLQCFSTPTLLPLALHLKQLVTLAGGSFIVTTRSPHYLDLEADGHGRSTHCV